MEETLLAEDARQIEEVAQARRRLRLRLVNRLDLRMRSYKIPRLQLEAIADEALKFMEAEAGDDHAVLAG